MYLTIYKTSAPEQLTFEQILKNPFYYLEPKLTKKKVTIEVKEDYAKSLFNKTYVGKILNIKGLEDETENHYSEFRIPKKSNPYKKRVINAPDDTLKTIQKSYLTLLQDYLHILPHKAAYAYTEKNSTVTAMQKHQANNSKWYLQIDLKNFFPSINEEFLRRMLLQVYPFPFLEEDVFEGLIKHSLLNGSTPQGSPLSPFLSNMVMVPIDYMITELLNNHNKHHYIYTRYADDITISCKQKFDPEEILEIIRKVFKEFDAPLEINNDKTRFGSTAGRNYHLGVIINKENQLSIGHEKNQQFRAMLYEYCTKPYLWSKHDVQKMLGLISYYSSIEPDFIEKTIKKYNKKFNTDIIATAKEKIK